MARYQIGALSKLISSQPDDGGGDVDDLFKPEEQPEPEPIQETFTNDVEVENTVEITDSSDKSEKNDKKNKKKSKKIKLEGKTDEDSDDEDKKFNQPSSKYKVKYEEENRAKPRDEEKEKRTIYIGNLPGDVTKKQIIALLKDCGGVETVRLRGAARPDMKTTKKQAIIQRKFHEKRNNIIAYARFKDIDCAQMSLKLNGNKMGDQTIRVDLALKDDSSSAQNRDQSKAIFVGNLGFATSEDQVREHFSKCGDITDVRIVRDSQTGIGKGFGYINFSSRESVKTALDLMTNTTLNGRELRVSQSVSRAKKTITMVPKAPKSGAFPSKKPDVAQFKKANAKVFKVKKNVPQSFVGKKATDVSVSSSKNSGGDVKKKRKKKPSQGERKRKMIAKHLLD